MNEVTRILNALAGGHAHASEELLPLVYDELRRLAARPLARERPGQTLDPTALVQEAYLRLAGSAAGARGEEPHWAGRRHFFATAAEAMRRILIEKARRKRRLKHGGDRRRVALDEALPAATPHHACPARGLTTSAALALLSAFALRAVSARF
jgi:RNA polymerase sigma factor (TIGR02999 family)